MARFTKAQIINELKIETNNFKEEVKGFIYYDEKEFNYAYETLLKKYKFVDYYTLDDIIGFGYHIYASNEIEYDAWQEDNKQLRK